MATSVAPQTASVHRFSFEDVVAMYDAGILDDNQRVELIDGMVIELSPAGPAHARIVERLIRHFVMGHERLRVRGQDTFLTTDGGFVLPDVMVLPEAGDDRLPDTALLAVEVSHTTRAHDRKKAARYAAAGVPEYWIIDVDREEVLVHTDPRDGVYASVERFGSASSIVALIGGPPVDVGALLAP